MRRWPFVRGMRRFFRYLNAGVLVCCFAGAGFVLGALDQLSRLMPDSEDLWTYRPRLATEIYSTEVHEDGSETHTLLARLFEEDRDPIELRDIPPDMIHATIAIEDRRFPTHRGVSPRDMLRAAWVDIRHKDVVQGASTITQQLVRNIWITRERTWDRKLKEAMLALETERRYSKDEILEMYLNQVCYGHGAFGVKTAARLYYGKAPKDLELHECAMLAGLPQWPVGYSPYRHPERCKKRRDRVLYWMCEEERITPAECAKAQQIPIGEGLQPLEERGIVVKHAPYFTHLVIRQLKDEYGYEAVSQGGLKVFTTLDMRVQKAAEEELTGGVERLRRQRQIRGGLEGQGALACLEVRTGRVLAMVGGVGPYEQVQYNRAHPGPPRYGRQPGSSFKPYVWAAALENGYGPDSVFSADPISIKIGQGKYWTPKNYSPSQGGAYTLRRALAQSVNLVSVRLVRKLTPGTVQRLASRMLDIPKERLRAVWAIALGTSELSPLEQASGYCCFANSGLRPTRRLVRRIEDARGQTVVSYGPELVRAIKSTTAMSMLSMLRTVVQSGTGTRARACGLPCGGKTGTTNSGRDVWWVGFTPDLSAAVWVGNDKNQPMPRGTGGGFCAPIWAKFIKRATNILGYEGHFPEGSGVTGELRGEPAKEEPGTVITVCVQTGLRANQFCPSTKEITIKRGETMPGICDMHHGPPGVIIPEGPGPSQPDRPAWVTVRICPSSGLLATPWCPVSQLKRFRAGRTPGAYCPLHGPWAGAHGRHAMDPEGPGATPPDTPREGTTGAAPGPAVEETPVPEDAGAPPGTGPSPELVGDVLLQPEEPPEP